MLGYIGLALLVIAYILLITRWSKLFIPVDAIASLILTIYAITLRDIPFIIVNGFITVILIIKFVKREEVK